MRLGWKLPKGLANVLVTGGARRIGRAIVEDLARNGFGVGIHCNRSCGEGNELAQAINAKGGRAVVVEADLTDLSEAAGLIRETESRLGPVSILVNNASLFERDEVTDFNWETWDRHFAIHLKAPVALARALAESLPEEAEGLVVNIIDQRVLRPNPTLFFLHAVEVGTVGRDGDDGAGAGAAHPRQCDRPRPDIHEQTSASG